MNVCMICVFPRHSQLHVVEEANETRQMCSAKSGTIVQGKIVCLSVCLASWLDVCLSVYRTTIVCVFEECSHERMILVWICRLCRHHCVGSLGREVGGGQQ